LIDLDKALIVVRRVEDFTVFAHDDTLWTRPIDSGGRMNELSAAARILARQQTLQIFEGGTVPCVRISNACCYAI
jgi:hypothetical protein